MKKYFERKKLIICLLTFLLFIFNANVPISSFKFFISSEFKIQKYWVGENHKIIIKKFPDNSDEKIYFKNYNNKVIKVDKDHFLMKSRGRECITAFTKINNINSTVCFNIYDTPDLNFIEQNPLKIEINNMKQLNLNIQDYPKSNIKYESNHPDIIKVNCEGKIVSLRPGNAIITASGLDNKSTQITVLSISNEGLLKNYDLDLNNVKQYENLMIVAHPDDEILWGGANLIKDSYFIVCLTNGYNEKRRRDFKNILKFTKNSGVILNYPDIQDSIQDNWSEVKKGMIKDLSYLINYKSWKKIVTHGPDGTTGHYHHKRISQYITRLTKENNKFNVLYYFGKFYRKNEIPKFLNRISKKELIYKKREVHIYKSVKKTINRIWFHFLQYENWIKANQWKGNETI